MGQTAAATAPDFAAAAEFMLGNMSARMADNLRDEVADRGTVAQIDGEMAMTAVTAAIRRLEVAGDIVLNPPEGAE